MKTKLKLLVITLLLSFPSFSQSDTSNVAIPYNVARLVAIDLIEGDIAKQELSITKELLTTTEQKSTMQDSIIASFAQKEVNYKSMITTYETRTNLCVSNNLQLQKKIEKQNAIKKLLTFSLGTVTLISVIAIAALL